MRIPWFLTTAIAVVLWGPVAQAEEVATDTVESIEACVRANLPKTTAVQTVNMHSKDRTGSERALVAKYYWKRGKKDLSMTLIEVEAPPDVRGSAYLLLEKDDRSDDLFSYLPELGKVRRLHASTMGGSLFGTDFSYEDFQRIVRVSGTATSTLLPDQDLSGRKVAVLESRPGPEEGSEYESIRTYVDRTTCVPLQVEFFVPGGELRKVMRADPSSLDKVVETWVARTIVLQDLLNQSETRLEVEEVAIDEKVPDRVFTVSNLERHH